MIVIIFSRPHFNFGKQKSQVAKLYYEITRHANKVKEYWPRSLMYQHDCNNICYFKTECVLLCVQRVYDDVDYTEKWDIL